MIIRDYSGYYSYGDDFVFWDFAEKQLEDIEATKKKAVAKAGEEAKKGATKATTDFLTTAAWVGAVALIAVVVLKMK